MLACGQLGKGGDGRLEMGRVARKVAVIAGTNDQPMTNVPSNLSCSHLRDVIHVAHAGAPGDLGRINLVSVELGVDILGNGRERHCRILGPEEIFRVKVVGFLLQSAVLG